MRVIENLSKGTFVAEVKWPLVTLMIPCFNQDRLVTKAIESALRQDYPNLEIIIADDASTDNTQEVVRKYLSDSRVKYFRSEKNLGRVSNYRKIIFEYASGDWLLNIDGDDHLVDDHYVSKAMALVRENPSLVLVFARMRWMDLKTNTYYDSSDASFAPVMAGNDLLMRYWEIPEGIANLTAIYRRQRAIEIDCHRNDHMFDDSEAFFKMIAGRDVGFVNTVAGCWYKHSGNYSGSICLTKRFKTFKMIEDPYEYYISSGTLSRDQAVMWRDKMAVRLLRDHLCFFIDAGSRWAAVKFALMSNRKFGAKVVLCASLNFRVLCRMISASMYQKIKGYIRAY